MFNTNYALKYTIDITNKDGGYTHQEATQQQSSTTGFTDALVLFSLIRQPDKSISIQVLTNDGQADDKQLPDKDMFHVLVGLAKHIADANKMPTPYIDHVKTFLNAVRATLIDKANDANPR